VRGRAGLVLPRMSRGRAAADGQVVDKQRRHERPGGGGLEDLHAEPAGSRVRRRQHAVPGHRPGAGGRGDVHRDGRATVPGDRGAPSLQALGQDVVGALLGDQAVADTRIGPGRVGGAEQPPAGQRPQRPAAELGGRGPFRVGASRLGDRLGGHGEHVGGRGQEREREIVPPGRQAHGQRVDRAGDPDVGRAVGVDVVAERQRAAGARQPVGHGGDVAGDVEAHPFGPIWVVGGALAGAVVRPGARDRGEQRPGAAPRQLEHPGPDGRVRQVDRSHPGAPVQQHRERADLGAGAEHGDRVPGQGQQLRILRDRGDGGRAGRLDDAGRDPRLQPPQQGIAAQPLPAVRHRQRAFRFPGAGHRGRGQLAPGRRRDQRAQPALGAVRADDAHPLVQRRQAVAGHRYRRLPGRQPGFDQPAEVRQVARPPVGLLAGGERPGLVHPVQRVGDDRLAQRGRAPAAVRGGGKRHPGLLVALGTPCRHETIMARGLSCVK
jgi:hypothetical protein